ncbi:MAG: hypothetical protein FWE82_00660 [Defluviitaleaceae bacterium]|nr:hypothetical protein [Defluviitaleaceae bacterium]
MVKDIPQKDADILRELAFKQRETAESPKMRELFRRWTKHNDCEGESPMVTVELWTFGSEVVPRRLRCESEKARSMEHSMVSHLIPFTEFGDDTPVVPYYSVFRGAHFKPFDIDLKVEHAAGSLGHQFVPQINDLEKDFHLLKKSSIHIAEADSVNAHIEYVNDLFGDILPPKISGRSLYCVLTQWLVHVMSLETILTSIYDYPDLFRKMMENLSNDCIEFFGKLESNGVLGSTAGPEGLGNGTYCFTDGLPAAKPPEEIYKVSEIWGFADSQETVCMSPEMFGEFIFPYYKKVTDAYGLMSYGCCEAVHPFWENSLSKSKNLRKLSISPWCDEAYMGRELAGKKIIYHRKPAANFLSDANGFDEGAFRASIKNTLRCAEGCKIEFTQRDVYTIRNDEDRVKRYVKILREEIEKSYGK